MNQPEFRSTSAMSEGEDWKPHAVDANGFYYDPNNPHNVVMGFLKKFVDDIPTKHNPMSKWVIQKCDPTTFQLGGVISVIEDTVLEKRREHVKIGGFIRITYMGRAYKKGEVKEYMHPQTGQMVPVPISKTNSYHMWDVAVWDACPKTYAEVLQLNGFEVPVQAPVYNATPMPQNQAPAAPAPQFQQQPSLQQPMNQPFQQGTVQQPPVQQQQFQAPPVQQVTVQQPQFQSQPQFNPHPQFQQGTVQQPPMQQPVFQQPAQTTAQPATFQQPAVNQAPPQFQQPVQNGAPLFQQPVFEQPPVQQGTDIITNQNTPYPGQTY